jgi:hypothetical protein
MRRFALIGAFIASTAAAQLRTLPADAERGELRHVRENVVELNGKRESLAPGARIRDQSNRIIVPSAVTTLSVVKYRRDANGTLSEVWILTPEEAVR